MNTKNSYYMGLLCLVMMAAGCQQAKVDSYSDPQFDPAAIDSYAWLPKGSIALGVVPQNLAVIEDTLRTSIDASLQQRGWSQQDPSAADVLVRFVVGAESTYEVEKTGISSVAGEQVEVPVEMKKMRSGRIAIDLIDARTQRIVWRGVTGATREGVPSQEQVAATIRRAVRAIFQKL